MIISVILSNNENFNIHISCVCRIITNAIKSGGICRSPTFIKFRVLLFSSWSGFMCMTFYRRDRHVIELQTGKAVSRPEEACSPPHFLQHSMPFLTLVSEYNSFSFDVACAFPFASSTRFSIVLLKRHDAPFNVST